jgi:soluble lytic murein transglycosylase-like protein
MAHDDLDPLTAGALVLGGAAAGYAIGARILEAWLRPRKAASPMPQRQTAAAAPQQPLSRRFDSVFERNRGSIPIEYLRALACRESDMSPSLVTGSARGVLQVIDVVRLDYNRRHGTRYDSDDLFDPDVNVAIACDVLRLIITSYRTNHPAIPNLQPVWTNDAFVGLLTLGWNAGFSEAGGVGRVARYLAARGITDITIDTVSRAAEDAGASAHVANPAKVAWCKSVVALYARERGTASTS